MSEIDVVEMFTLAAQIEAVKLVRPFDNIPPSDPRTMGDTDQVYLGVAADPQFRHGLSIRLQRVASGGPEMQAWDPARLTRLDKLVLRLLATYAHVEPPWTDEMREHMRNLR